MKVFSMSQRIYYKDLEPDAELIIKKGNMNSFYNEMVSSVAYFANPNLKWEKTRSTNIGLESSFLDNRLQLEMEYYHKKTVDAFMNKTISDINGYTSYVVNSGTITNSGFNFTVTATPIKLKNFYWIFVLLTLNLAQNIILWQIKIVR